MDERFWIEIGITALIAFGATFAGVYVAFSKERRRTEAEESEQFGRVLHGLLIESANNLAILTNLQNRVRPGTVPADDVYTDALQVALGSPLFYRKADHSLVLAARIVRAQLGTMSNVLALYRQAGAVGRQMAAGDVRGVQVRAETSKEVIRVMQELLDAKMPEFGAAVVADARLKEVERRLTEILRKERGILEGLDNQGPVS